MVVLRLAYVNTKRILRNKGLRGVFLVLPLAFALLRAIFAKNLVLLRAAELCPVVCVLLLATVLYSQWSMDADRGFVAGLRNCPISQGAIITSRVISGVLILAAQMTLFGGILILRF